MNVFAYYFGQLRAMLVRNLILKRREIRKTSAEILLPLYSFGVLALLKVMLPNPNFPAILQPQTRRLMDSFPLEENHTIVVVPNTTDIQWFLGNMSEFWNVLRGPRRRGYDLNFAVLGTRGELQERYWRAPNSVPAAVIFNSNPFLERLEYEIRTNPSYAAAAAPNTAQLYSTPTSCRNSYHIFAKILQNSHIFEFEQENCPAYQYYSSYFSALQTLVDYTKIFIESGDNFTIPNINVQMFPKEAYTANWMLAFRLIIPAYLVMSLSQFVTYLLMLVVGEKEKKIKENMKMMGLKDSVFWLSWYAIYAAFVLMLSVVATIIMFSMKVLQHSDFLLIFTLIFSYGLSIIFYSFMLTPFFNKSKTAGVVGNFSLNLLSLLYFLQVLTKLADPVILGFMSLVSSAAFTIAMDKAFVMDMQGEGLKWSNIWSGPGLSFGHSVIILCFDNFLYASLAYYLDIVIPGEYGTKRNPCFFFTPLCNFPPFKKGNSGVEEEGIEFSTFDVEPVAASMTNLVAIEIVGLHKTYPSYCGSSETVALNGINLKIYEGEITAILGHNGAGKTTMFNILTGMAEASRGAVYIFGHDIRTISGLSAIRRMTGVCPQHDILFPNMTATEHLRLYAAIKGVDSSDISKQVDGILEGMDLKGEADTLCKYLSGGDKRKLSVGIAIIGSPKIIILDEPTAGVDPYSRRHMWSVLQKLKPGKVILLTTHFMDEADILADRKAVVCKGKLKCCGSSMFLKNKFGVGYHLTLVLDRSSNESRIAAMIKKRVPNAEKARSHGKELSFVLPYDSVDKFPGLFAEIEQVIRNKTVTIGINGYGISMTTLEEVFLHLEKEEDPADDGDISKRIIRTRVGSSDFSERRFSSNSSDEDEIFYEGNRRRGGIMENYDFSPNALQMVIACVKLRLLCVYRDPYRWIVMLLLPLILAGGGLWFNSIIGTPEKKMKSLLLDNRTYEWSKLAIWSDFSLPLEEFFEIPRASFEGNFTDLLGGKSLIASLNFTNCCEILDLTISYNDTMVHSLPVVLNAVNNAIYRYLSNDSNKSITVISHPFLTKSQPDEIDVGILSSAYGVGVVFVLLPVLFVIDIVHDREIRVKNQLHAHGVSFLLYYGSFFSVFSCATLLVLTCHLALILAFGLRAFCEPAAFLALTALLLLYTPCAVLCVTCLSFAFHKAESVQAVLTNFVTFLGAIPFTVIAFADAFKIDYAYIMAGHAFFSITNTMYAPFAMIYFVGRVYLTCRASDSCTYVTAMDYLNAEILILVAACSLQIVAYGALLKYLEDGWRWVGGDSSGKYALGEDASAAGSGEVANEDGDVRLERMRVENLANSAYPTRKHPVIIAQNLRKEYKSQEDGGCCRKTRPGTMEGKTAVLNFSLAVEPGEVFGLLGHNGAGKTTTMKIIAGEEVPTKGKVLLAGRNVADGIGHVRQLLGYCPQHDALWKYVTVREHIEFYAAIRGVPSDKIESVTNEYLSRLQMKEHANKQSHQCSGGTRRKLSFAISVIGNPKVVLLDEPSTGMDPMSKRFMWDAILASFQGTKGAILTTHSMEEADALCSRVGIMVKGRLKCIGSTQHLKNLYGAGYTLEIKLADNDRSENVLKDIALKHFIMMTFPGATLEETFSDHLIFSVPQASVRSLAHCFSELENGGCGRSTKKRTVVGGWAWAWWLVTDVQYISLEVMTLNPVCENVETMQGVPLTVTGVAQCKIIKTEELLQTACEQFLGKSKNEIKATILQTLEGHLRAILGTLTVEEVYRDRDQFASLVREVAAPDVGRMGIEILSFTIKDIFDSVQYLSSLGKAQTAAVKRDAQIGVALAIRDAGIKEAECEKSSMDTKYSTDSKIEDNARMYKLQKANFDKEINTAKAEAQLAYELQAAKNRQQIRNEEIQIEVVERRKQIEIEEHEIARKEKELAATVKLPAEAESYMVQAIAEGKRTQTLEVAKAEAERIRKVGAAQAYNLEVIGAAEAQRMKIKAQAYKGYEDAAIAAIIWDALPKIAAEIAAPLSKTEEIVLLGGSDNFTGEVTRIASQLPPAVKALTGVDLSKVMSKIPGAK